LIPSDEHEDFLKDTDGKFDIDPNPDDVGEDILAVAAKVKRYVAHLEGGDQDEEEEDEELLTLRTQFDEIMEMVSNGQPVPAGMVEKILSRHAPAELRPIPSRVETPRQQDADVKVAGVPLGLHFGMKLAANSGKTDAERQPGPILPLQLDTTTSDAFEPSRSELNHLATPETVSGRPVATELRSMQQHQHALARVSSVAPRGGVYMQGTAGEKSHVQIASTVAQQMQTNQGRDRTRDQFRPRDLQLQMWRQHEQEEPQQRRESRWVEQKATYAHKTGPGLSRNMRPRPQTPRQLSAAPTTHVLSQQQTQRQGQHQHPVTPTTTWKLRQGQPMPVAQQAYESGSREIFL